MNGLELLKEKMVERGCTRAQTESKFIPIILDILAGCEDLTPFTDVDEARRELTDLKSIYNRLALKYKSMEYDYNGELGKYKVEHERKMEELNREIRRYEELKKEILTPENPELRDRLRLVKIYNDSVRVDTKYDNTAYIVGLASILSGIQKNPVEELKKINNKL